jgi:hypothetical protein
VKVGKDNYDIGTAGMVARVDWNDADAGYTMAYDVPKMYKINPAEGNGDAASFYESDVCPQCPHEDNSEAPPEQRDQADRMEANTVFDAAIDSLSRNKLRISDAPNRVPPKPGLYAIYGDGSVWTTLGVTSTVEGGPLYVGKSEDNLLAREVFTHFNASATRKPATGSSTVRRSFAALLRTELHLQSQSRNPLKPASFASYGLVGDGDLDLTVWMAQNLELAIWEKPDVLVLALRDIETQIIHHWDPPINIDKAPTSRHHLKALRALLAREARVRAKLSETLSM